MRPLAFAVALLAAPALAQDAADATAAAEVAPPDTCVEGGGNRSDGPIVLGYQEADVATGRRLCPRNEVGLGTHTLLIIDTPNYYGDVLVEAIVFASYKWDSKTELYGYLEAVDWEFVQNASLKSSSVALGNLTVGATRQLWDRGPTLLGGATARLLLPTSFTTPGSRPLGIEAGHLTTWLPMRMLEVHSFIGADVSIGLGDDGALPRGGGVLALGAQLSPLQWFGVALDVTGRLDTARSYLAPALALRFAFARFGVELAASLPLAGDDRHDLVMGLRLSYRP
jgi:hypothetical protein